MLTLTFCDSVFRSAVNTSRMWIRGSGLGLSWRQSKEMKKIAKDTWGTSLKFQMRGQLYNCVKSKGGNVCGKKLEFRIRRGQDTVDMLGANFAISLPLSQSTLLSGRSSSTTVYPWFFNQDGEMKEEKLFSPELQENRNVQLYLPPSFRENFYKKYDVVFVNDGDVVSPIVAVTKLGSKMAAEGTLKEFVLVGLKNTGTEGDRTPLLTPSNGTNMMCRNGTFGDGCSGCNFCSNCSHAQQIERLINKCTKWVPTAARGERYLDFIQYTLLSHVELRYRVLSQQQHVGIMGYSLGGLISCHAAWTRPTVFGSAACMSPSLWWPLPLNSKYPDDVEAEFINVTLKQLRDNRPMQKIYLDVGTHEDPPGPSLMLERVIRAAADIENTPFFELNKNLWLQVLDKEFHTGQAFVRRAWLPLYILYAPEGSARTEKDSPDTGTKNSKICSGADSCKLPTVTLILSLIIFIIATK